MSNLIKLYKNCTRGYTKNKTELNKGPSTIHAKKSHLIIRLKQKTIKPMMHVKRSDRSHNSRIEGC